MTNSEDHAETLDEFAKSFFYGSRSDISLKFVKDLTEAEVGDFLTEMLTGVVAAIDDGDVTGLTEKFLHWQKHAYVGHLGKFRFQYDDVPFVKPSKPLADSRVALFTSSGHFVQGDDPEPFGVKDMTQQEAENRIIEFIGSDPSLSTIPVDTPGADIRVRHGGYPVGPAQQDHNVALPLDVLNTMAQTGVIGEVSANAYSFVGATSQIGLRKKIAPQWAQQLLDDDVDLALLVPL